MDKKDLYMTLGELLRTYSGSEIDKALENIYKLYEAENCMGETISIKQLKKGKEYKDALSKKKSNNRSRSD